MNSLCTNIVVNSNVNKRKHFNGHAGEKVSNTFFEESFKMISSGKNEPF